MLVSQFLYSSIKYCPELDECPQNTFPGISHIPLLERKNKLKSRDRERSDPLSPTVEAGCGYCTLAFRTKSVWFTGSGWASVLNTQSSRDSTSSSQNRRYRYLQLEEKIYQGMPRGNSLFCLSQLCYGKYCQANGMRFLGNTSWLFQ